MGSLAQKTSDEHRVRDCAFYDLVCKSKRLYEYLRGEEPLAGTEISPGELGSGSYDPVPDSVRKGLDELKESFRDGAEKAGQVVKVVFYVGVGLAVLWLATRTLEAYSTIRRAW
ncbi:MAG: hypothetical protein C4293_03490 [Nitrospiraceae bacterium]